MLHVQEFLRFHKKTNPDVDVYDALKKCYGINHKRHCDYPNLVLLKYDQIDSPMGEKIVQECRGLILDEDNDWKIVAYPFKKFFNYGEPNAAQIEWDSATVFEKLDGSLCTMYWYDGRWNVATSGCPDGQNQVGGWSDNFEHLFWKTFLKMGYNSESLADNYTCFSFMFELMTPYNQIVVRHDESTLRLIGVRNILTGQELSVDLFSNYFLTAKEYSISNWDETLAAADKLNPLETEGYVVVDKWFNRVKVKSPRYVALHHMKDGLGASPRRMLELIKNNESDEFLSYFPEFRDQYNKAKSDVQDLVKLIKYTYNLIKDIPDQKTFALCATKTKFSGTLFGLRSGKTKSVEDWLRDVDVKKLEEML